MAVQADDLDRWVQFCNNTEAWDKAWKVAHAAIRMLSGLAPTADSQKLLDYLWRYLLDARKTSWMLKWAKEIHGARAALRAPDPPELKRLKVAVRLMFMGRWIFENLFMLTKLLPNGKGNILGLQDTMRMNRAAKFCWQGALITNVWLDIVALRLLKAPETAEARKMRLLRLVNAFCDTQTCLNMMQVPQIVSKATLGREVAFTDAWLGLNGVIAGLIQCYTVYPARPASAIVTTGSGVRKFV